MIKSREYYETKKNKKQGSIEEKQNLDPVVESNSVNVDPSEKLAMVANTFVSWYKLVRRTNPPEIPRDSVPRRD